MMIQLLPIDRQGQRKVFEALRHTLGLLGALPPPACELEASHT